MSIPTYVYTDVVRPEWIDFNGHMTDAAYAIIFSYSLNELMNFIRLNEQGRAGYDYTIFTLETRLIYLKEAKEGEALHVTMQLIDTDTKRLHVFFTMENKSGDCLATSEQMLIGMDTKAHQSAVFPDSVQTVIDRIWDKDQEKEIPKEVGRIIGIRRRQA